MRGRVVIVDEKALAGCLEGAVAFLFAVSPSLKGVLPMGEGQAGMGAGKGRIEPHSHPEKMLGQLVLRPGEAVHVPEAAVIGLPGIQRVRRFEDRAVALDHLDLGRDRRDDAVADLVEDQKVSSSL